MIFGAKFRAARAKRKRVREERAAQAEAHASDRRRWPRIKLDARVVIAYPNVEKLITGPLSDISMGGLFIRTTALRPIGTGVFLKIELERETLTLEAQGRVVRLVDENQSRETGAPVGMGIAFDDLDEGARAALSRLIEAAGRAQGSAV